MEKNLSKKALALLKEIASKHGLSFRINDPPEAARPIEFFFVLPIQKGLDFEIQLYLDGDALHITTDDYWMEYFPFGKGCAEESFVEALEGLINGQCRLVKYYRLRSQRHFKTKLQKLENGKWLTRGINRKSLFPTIFGYRSEIVQNTPHSS